MFESLRYMPKFGEQSHCILGPAQKVAGRAALVKISAAALRQLANELSLQAQDKQPIHWLTLAPGSVTGALAALPLNLQVFFLTVFHSAGFSYWGEPRWSVAEGDTTYNGAMAWLISLSRSKQLLDPAYLAALTAAEWQNITQGLGPTQMPMAAERLSILQMLGNIWQSSEDTFIRRFTAGGAALDLAFFIGAELPGFDDRAIYDNLTIPFLKRAQLLAGDLNHLFNQEGLAPLANMDGLTACADYKIPQFLRQKGVLVYHSRLAEKIDKLIEIAPSSKEEVEIRACTLVAVELLRKALVARQITLSAWALDNNLWLASQRADQPASSPYHRCRTIFY
jgi:hypothetical protein